MTHAGGASKSGRRTFALAGALSLGTALAGPAQAADITFAVIGPHEYDLPINFQPFNAFVQYGNVNSNAKSYDSRGLTINGPRGNQFIGLSKYVRFFTVDALPDTGFGFQLILPEARIDQPGLDIGGIGDPLIGLAIWRKPTPNSTLGFQSFVQPPIGSRDITGDSWNNLTSIFYDYQWEHVSLTGNTGVILRGDRLTSGQPAIDQATTFHSNLRLGYKNETIFEPFLAIDYQLSDKSYFRNGRAVSAPYSDETALGGGVMFKFSPSFSATFRYSHAVAGRNSVQSDAFYFKIAYVN